MKIVVGVTGSIAAYKAIDLVNQCRKLGHEVRVVMTKHAADFVQPLTFEAIAHAPVVCDMFAEGVEALAHISLAKWADVCIVAPADANVIAKMAHGLADDFLTTFILAFDGPVLVAPAMNTVMYHQQVTQDNLARLKSYGYEIVSPASGQLACGDIGEASSQIWRRCCFIWKKASPRRRWLAFVSSSPPDQPLHRSIRCAL